MTILLNNKEACLDSNYHTPNRSAISVIAQNAYDADEFTFCEVCEQNISRFSFYDEDRGMVFSKWVIE